MLSTFSCVYWSCWVLVATCGFSLVVASMVYCVVVLSAHFFYWVVCFPYTELYELVTYIEEYIKEAVDVIYAKECIAYV